MSQTIEVPRVDINMLREQRDELLDLMSLQAVQSGTPLDGLINLLDTMLDIAEGESSDQ